MDLNLKYEFYYENFRSESCSLEFFIGLANLSRADQPCSIYSYFMVFAMFCNAGVLSRSSWIRILRDLGAFKYSLLLVLGFIPIWVHMIW